MPYIRIVEDAELDPRRSLRVADYVPHEVRPPSTEDEILLSDNRVIREYYKKAKKDEEESR